MDLDKPILKVSQVAKEIGVSPDRLRTYDEEGLISPRRGDNNTRLYSYNDVEWLICVRELIAKNRLSILGLKEILRITYFIGKGDFENFMKNREKSSIWHTIDKMRKNPNYEKLRVIYK